MTVALATGCATVTPRYSVRPTPTPVESQQALDIERTISNYQAQDLEKSGPTRLIRPGERVYGFEPHTMLQRLAKATERSNLNYRLSMIENKDPNAAALADGRVYITTGLLDYLAKRGSREDELALILGHELAHTVAQHLVERYEQVQKQQMMLAIVGLGTAAVTKGGSARAQQLGQLAQDVANIVAQVQASGYSQEQELEADQLGARYMIRAGYDPQAAIAMLEDFQRFDQPSVPFLRTHPVTARRVEDLRRYLQEIGYGRSRQGAGSPSASTGQAINPTRAMMPARSNGGRQDDTRRRLRSLKEIQKLYPRGSQSWNNLQKQIDALE